MRRSNGREDSVVPIFTQWRGYGLTLMKGGRRQRGSFAPKWRRPVGSRSASFRTRRHWHMKTALGPKASTSVLRIQYLSHPSTVRKRLPVLATAGRDRRGGGVR